MYTPTLHLYIKNIFILIITHKYNYIQNYFNIVVQPQVQLCIYIKNSKNDKINTLKTIVVYY